MIWDYYKTIWCGYFDHAGSGWFGSDKKDINATYEELNRKMDIYKKAGCSCEVEVREKI